MGLTPPALWLAALHAVRNQRILTTKSVYYNLLRAEHQVQVSQAALATAKQQQATALKLNLGQIGQKPLVSKNGFIEWMPLMLNGWTQTRDLKAMPAQSFREWWKERTPNTVPSHDAEDAR